MTDTKELTSLFQGISLPDFQVKFNQQIAVAMHWQRPGGSPDRNTISGAAEFLNGVEKAKLAQISEFYATLSTRYAELGTIVNSGATDWLPTLYLLHGVIQLIEYLHAIEIGKYGKAVTPESVLEQPAPVEEPGVSSLEPPSLDVDDADDEEDEQEDDAPEDPEEVVEPEPAKPKKPKKPKAPKA